MSRKATRLKKSEMIRFDWLVIENLPIDTIIRILNALVYTENLTTYPPYVLKPISKFKDMSAFLINPSGLILNRRKYTDSDIYVYLELASLRSYIIYKRTGSLRLPTYCIQKNYDLDKLKMNPLLDVTDDEIIFRYEETK